VGDALLAAARHSFSHSMNVAALVGTIMLAVTAVAVTLVLRGTTPPEVSPAGEHESGDNSTVAESNDQALTAAN
jgi:DHA2 family multidrug resistance protein-like MFS transporter